MALSDIIILGTPLCPQNLLKACKKTVVDNSLVSSRCSARGDAHVNKQTYALISLLSARLTRVSLTYNGPAESIPVLLKGGSVLTLSDGKGGTGGVEYGFPSCFQHTMHLLTTLFTASLPLTIQ